MTIEHNFKVGDKVATTKPYDIAINGNTTTIPIGEEGVIEDMYNDELYVYISEYHIYITLPICDIELITPLDRRTAFLRELQALLRKYDARIEPYFSLYADVSSIDLYLGNDCGVCVNPDKPYELGSFKDCQFSISIAETPRGWVHGHDCFISTRGCGKGCWHHPETTYPSKSKAIVACAERIKE